MKRALTATALAITLCAGTLWTAHARAAEPQTYNLTLRAEQVSRGEDGRLVITAATSDPIKGALTLTITGADASGAITNGEWALVNTFVETVYGAGHSADDGHDEEYPGHEIGVRMIQRGTLAGALTGGAIAVDANGAITALNGIQLSISKGSLTYASVTSGTATLTLSGPADPATSSGTAAFIF